MTLYVNGCPITEDEIRQEMDRMRPHYNDVIENPDSEENQRQLYDWSRENLIERVLLLQAALQDPDPVPDDELEKAWQNYRDSTTSDQQPEPEMDEATFKQKALEQLKLERYINKITENVENPTETEIQAFYDENQDKFMRPDAVRAAHIVKHITYGEDINAIRQQMQSALQQLRSGAAAFDDLARQYSDCPENGGDLGYFPRGQMVPEFEEKVFNMNVGDISDVFQTEFGFHIATVTDKQAGGPASLDEVREPITQELTRQKQEKALEDVVDNLKATAAIEQKP